MQLAAFLAIRVVLLHAVRVSCTQPYACIDGGACVYVYFKKKRWWCMRNEKACTLTVEGEDVLEDVVLDVGYPAAGDGVVGVEERAAAERRLELGVAADELQPHPFGVVEESEFVEVGEVRDQAQERVLARIGGGACPCAGGSGCSAALPRGLLARAHARACARWRRLTCAPQAAAAHTPARGECSLECLCGSGGGSPACPAAAATLPQDKRKKITFFSKEPL